MTLPASPLVQSLLIHGILGGVFLLTLVIHRPPIKVSPPLKVEIKEVTLPKEAPEDIPIVVTTTPKLTNTKTNPIEPKKIFGINKNTLTNEGNASAVAIKAGNTIAKEVDQTPMRPEDETSLPIPAEEYLISNMPKLKTDIKIPYPPEARKNNIEGLVVLEILIDENGKVRSANLIEGPGFGLNEAALKSIYDFEFSPAMIDQKPVPVKIKYGYRFILN